MPLIFKIKHADPDELFDEMNQTIVNIVISMLGELFYSTY